MINNYSFTEPLSYGKKIGEYTKNFVVPEALGGKYKGPFFLRGTLDTAEIPPIGVAELYFNEGKMYVKSFTGAIHEIGIPSKRYAEILKATEEKIPILYNYTLTGKNKILNLSATLKEKEIKGIIKDFEEDVATLETGEKYLLIPTWW